MTVPTRNRPTDFLFVNKDAASKKLSKSEGGVMTVIFRHVQEHIRSEKGVKIPPQINQRSLKHAKHSPPTASSDQANATTSKPILIEPVFIPENHPNDEDSPPNSRGRGLDQTSADAPELPYFDGDDKQLAEWHGRENVSPNSGEGLFSLPCFISSANKAVDPFDSVPVQITRSVHHLLMFFESMFFSNTATRPSSSNYLSASRNVIRDCIFDEVQLKCLLASIASRREIFDHQLINGGATWYIQQAVMALQDRLRHSSVIDHKLMYAMIKLYVAEAYQSNAEAALTHLRGAQTAYNQIGTWHDFDTSYTPTLCASGEAFFLPRVWKTPTVFPTLADPGPAMACFSTDLVQQYVLDSMPRDSTAQKLLSELSNYPIAQGQSKTLQEIIAEILEFSSVRQAMLSREHLDLAIPVLVSQWAHLRRFALVFRLMSVPILNNDFLHAVRVSLVLWLQMIANYSGFDQSLKIVARHLTDIVVQALLYGNAEFSEVMVWVCLIGASTGNGDTRKWFIGQLSRLSMRFDPNCSMSMDELRMFLVTKSQGCLYCELLQRQSHLDIARDVFLDRLRQGGLA
ncbi:uncharacterized protein PAC_06765 [Phialocephala subalpina]|uniref:Transcription factor domain-containing protein n=1 Tax=Phialocephala subalpina TaxID=576137 RepID=A0A1L7WVT5_9HELO|nr:uncharacterized protein PAC_06765 [Phialocephala subalpina]